MNKLIYFLLLVLALMVSVALFLFFAGGSEDHDHEDFADLPSEAIERAEDEPLIVPRTVGVNPVDIMPLDEVLNATPSAYAEDMLTAVHLDSYAILPCTTVEDAHTMILTAKYTEDPAGNHIRDAVTTIETWEPGLLMDIGSYIFPALSGADRSQFLTFEEDSNTANLKKASVQIGGVERFVYAGWVLNYVLYTSAPQCLQEAANSLYPVH